MVLSSGEIIEASPTINSDIYYGVIGGYGGLGIVAEVVLELVPNTKIEQQQIKINVSDYKKARAITWVETEKPVTIPHRITKNKQSYAIERYFIWAITSTPLGKWRREYIIDPVVMSHFI